MYQMGFPVGFTDEAYQRSTHELNVSDLLKIKFQSIEFKNDKHILIVGDSFAYDIAYLFAHHKPSIKYTLESFEDPLESICKTNYMKKLKNERSLQLCLLDEGFKIPCTNKIIESLERKESNSLYWN